MSRIYNSHIIEKIRLCALYSLIFFVLAFSGCSSKQGPKEIDIVWDNEKAIGISIPQTLTTNLPADSLSQLLRVRMAGNGQNINMLGDMEMAQNGIVFKPLIPLSSNQTYIVNYRDRQIGSVTIPSKKGNAPELVAIYPSQDTLPENLLKIYLKFSRPMREGQSQKHIALLNTAKDTVQAVFLDLQPELWNKNGTILTIWLDPGRIKRELQPNQRLGNPLKNGNKYTIAVSDKWQDAEGMALVKPYSKIFTASSRDGLSPDIAKWAFNIPKAGTTEPLEIDLDEALDYFLLNETISILDPKGQLFACRTYISNKEKTLSLVPLQNWKTGKYLIRVEPRLEDLAGNNLDRLFDMDIKAKKPPMVSRVFVRDFIVVQ